MKEPFFSKEENENAVLRALEDANRPVGEIELQYLVDSEREIELLRTLRNLVLSQHLTVTWSEEKDDYVFKTVRDM